MVRAIMADAECNSHHLLCAMDNARPDADAVTKRTEAVLLGLGLGLELELGLVNE